MTLCLLIMIMTIKLLCGLSDDNYCDDDGDDDDDDDDDDDGVCGQVEVGSEQMMVLLC